MKKIITILMALSVLGAILTGCSKPAEDAPATGGTTGTEATGTTTGS